MPGNLALRQIRHFQHTQATMVLIQKLPFLRVMCEIAQDFKMELCFTATAILALHQATEYFLVDLMEKVNLATIHRKRISIAPHICGRKLFDVHTYIIQDRCGYGLIVQKGSGFFCYLFGGGVSMC